MIQAICWTLIHSLWQGLLFAVITGLVMLLTRQASAALRYNVLCVLFFLFLGVCAGTFVYEQMSGGQTGVKDAVFSVAATRGQVAMWIEALGNYCSGHALLIVWVWLFVFAIKSLHMLGSFLYTQRLRHYGIRMAPEGWQEKVDRLCRQMGIRRAVRLVESRIVKMPLVIGHWRPVIFFPLGLITGLPEGEIEAVLLHELAHIRRHDYIVNFLQHLAVNLLFFNPGFLWISALLREERENCCDDVAVARIHDRTEFIRALISFKEHDLRLAGLANAFPAGKNQLVKRVRRIAQNTNKTLDPIEKVFLMVSFALISLLVAGTTGDVPASPAHVAQMPGGRYRVFIDKPATVERAALDEKNVGYPEKVMVRPAGRDVVRPTTNPDRKELTHLREIYAADAIAFVQKQNLEAAEREAAEKEAAFEKLQLDESVRQAQIDKDQAKVEQDLAERDAKQALLDKAQAERDAEQAAHDREQAVRDREQAERDAKQVIKDKEQADRDRAHGDKHRQ